MRFERGGRGGAESGRSVGCSGWLVGCWLVGRSGWLFWLVVGWLVYWLFLLVDSVGYSGWSLWLVVLVGYPGWLVGQWIGWLVNWSVVWSVGCWIVQIDLCFCLVDRSVNWPAGYNSRSMASLMDWRGSVGRSVGSVCNWLIDLVGR